MTNMRKICWKTMRLAGCIVRKKRAMGLGNITEILKLHYPHLTVGGVISRELIVLLLTEMLS